MGACPTRDGAATTGSAVCGGNATLLHAPAHGAVGGQARLKGRGGEKKRQEKVADGSLSVAGQVCEDCGAVVARVNQPVDAPGCRPKGV